MTEGQSTGSSSEELRSKSSASEIPDQEPTDRSGTSTSTTRLTATATIVAVALIVTYVIFLALQWNQVNATDLSWSRRSDLLGGVEALAFAAAGALLGTTIQRQVTRKAEDQAADAERQAREQKARADANQVAAEKGRALHHLATVKAQQQAAASAAAGTRAFGGQQGSPGGDLAEMLGLAQMYDQQMGGTSPTPKSGD